MTISVVQTLSVQQSLGGSFASNVTAGNSIVIALTAFTTAGATISSSSPTFNALPVTGSVLGIHNQSSTSGNNVYAAIWLLPNVTGGAKPIAYSVTNGGTATAVGFTAWEVAGLGASPSFDQVSPLTGKGTSGTTLASGSTPAITAAPEFIAAVAVSFGNAITKAGAPWTEVNSAGGTDSIQGEQIVTSSGGTFSYAPVAAGSADWVSMVATIKGTGGAAAPSGQLEPRATVPLPSRYPARARVGRALAAAAGILGTANAHGGNGHVQPQATFPLPRRYPARARVGAACMVAAGLIGPANAHGPSGHVQPRATVQIPRRTAARAVVAHVTGPANAHGPAGHMQPRATVPVPRRTTARAVIAHVIGPGNQTTPPPRGQVQPKPVVGRRTVARGQWAGTTVRTVNATPAAPVNGQVQPRATVPQPRRQPPRAVWRGVAVAAQVAVKGRPRPVIPRRSSARAVVRGNAARSAVQGAPVPAPRQRPVIPRRAATRVSWSGTTVRTVNAPFVQPQQGTVTLASALTGSVALASAAASVSITSQLTGSVTIESTI